MINIRRPFSYLVRIRRFVIRHIDVNNLVDGAIKIVRPQFNVIKTNLLLQTVRNNDYSHNLIKKHIILK